ncbi:uncharacterized protein MONBRDRAFT_26247 [Monosiga brevicollis MX1]|uniref:Uncharacterized protein n=1 Tax=Monosiga brevicollis TaxID=81824 RepID=A9V1T5_MONBE|nr:uncharacterized protein MONBRDRAFT_26247 [Monosiga brevicollis MX1]EDQ88619.1 predicted protein [Monosiga brevicollis MX1]|eukprot:XP_001746723.1 hypothetical protein [Monosiga brevicollis MX1]
MASFTPLVVVLALVALSAAQVTTRAPVVTTTTTTRAPVVTTNNDRGDDDLDDFDNFQLAPFQDDVNANGKGFKLKARNSGYTLAAGFSSGFRLESVAGRCRCQVAVECTDEDNLTCLRAIPCESDDNSCVKFKKCDEDDDNDNDAKFKFFAVCNGRGGSELKKKDKKRIYKALSKVIRKCDRIDEPCRIAAGDRKDLNFDDSDPDDTGLEAYSVKVKVVSRSDKKDLKRCFDEVDPDVLEKKSCSIRLSPELLPGHLDNLDLDNLDLDNLDLDNEHNDHLNDFNLNNLNYLNLDNHHLDDNNDHDFDHHNFYHHDFYHDHHLDHHHINDNNYNDARLVPGDAVAIVFRCVRDGAELTFVYQSQLGAPFGICDDVLGYSAIFSPFVTPETNELICYYSEETQEPDCDATFGDDDENVHRICCCAADPSACPLSADDVEDDGDNGSDNGSDDGNDDGNDDGDDDGDDDGEN